MFATRLVSKAGRYGAHDALLADDSERLAFDRLGSFRNLSLARRPHISMHKTRRLSVTVVNNTAGLGVVVAKLSEDSAAYAAGLRCGDCLTHVNGVEVNTHQEAIGLVDATDVGDELNCTLLAASPVHCVVLQKSEGSLGLTLEGDSARGGVFVKSLKATGAASRAGLQPGDELLAIDGSVPTDHAEATATFKRAQPADELSLLVVPARVYTAPYAADQRI